MYEYWLIYFGQSKKLLRGTWRTIGHALADWLLRDASEAERYRKLEILGQRLNTRRDYAITLMREQGKTVCVSGGRCIDKITIGEADSDEHNRRCITQGQQKIMATENKCYDLNRNRRNDYGWLFEKDIRRVQKRLNPGNDEPENGQGACQ